MVWLFAQPSFWAVLAGIIAITAEYMYIRIQVPWWHYLWVWVPMQVLMSYCIYRLVTYQSANLLTAFVLFGTTTIGLRVLVTLFVLDSPVSRGTWIALLFMLVARISNTWIR